MTEPTLPADSVVQKAMNAWRLQNDPIQYLGPTMAEYVVTALRDAGLLIDGQVSE